MNQLCTNPEESQDNVAELTFKMLNEVNPGHGVVAVIISAN